MNETEIEKLVQQHLPSWAIKRASGLEVGAQLPTRDGRVTGNAHIISVRPAPRGRLGLEYVVLTDAGNRFVMSEPELTAQFYPPEFVSSVDEILRKFGRKELAEWA